jgi:Na+/proline symporter
LNWADGLGCSAYSERADNAAGASTRRHLHFQTGVTYMATPFVSVILLGILWKRTNYTGAMAGLLGGLVIQIDWRSRSGRWESS